MLFNVGVGILSAFTFIAFLNFMCGHGQKLLIRHLLDSMHIVKNVSTQVMEQLGLQDTTAARKDLQEAGCKREWWPNEAQETQGRRARARARRRRRGRSQAAGTTRGNNHFQSPPPWVIGYGTSLSRKEVETELQKRVYNIRPPMGYGPNLRQSFQKSKEDKISGLKGHDHYHLLLDIWPVVLKGLVGKDVHRAIADLAEVLHAICGKEIDRSRLGELKDNTTENYAKWRWSSLQAS